MSNWFGKNNLRRLGLVAGAVAALFLVFCLGLAVGAQGLRPLARTPLRFLLQFGLDRGARGYGVVGTVTAINGSTIIIQSAQNESSQVTVTANTVIDQERGHHLKLADIHVGDHVLVLGSPHNGVIDARFVRLQRGSAGSAPTAVPTSTPALKN